MMSPSEGEQSMIMKSYWSFTSAIAFSDDGRGVQSAEMMRSAMIKAKELNKIIAAHCEDNSVDTLKGVKADVDAFVGEAEQFDDITMLTVEYKGV